MNGCKFCGSPVPAGKVGANEREYCGDKCRAGYHKATRALGARAIDAGFLGGLTPKEWLARSEASYTAGK